jgi:hypothetical protein
MVRLDPPNRQKEQDGVRERHQGDNGHPRNSLVFAIRAGNDRQS